MKPLAALAGLALAAALGHEGHARTGGNARIYVADQAAAKVTVIDPATDSVLQTVDLQALGFSAHAKPHHIAVEPDGSYWYVSLVGDNAVVKFDRDNHVLGKATMETPGLLALDPTSDRLYATRSMSAVNAPSRIGVIDRKDMSIEEVDVVVPRPHALAVTPDGKYAYVGSLGTNQIAVYDPAKDRVGVVNLPLDTTQVMVQFAVSPDGRTMAASAQFTGQLLGLSLADPAKPALTHVVRVGDWPWHICFSPDGGEVWVPNQQSNDVNVVNTRTWTVTRTVSGPGFAQPHGIAYAPNGRVFVSNHNTGKTMDKGGVMMAAGATDAPGHVVVIDATSGRVLKVIDTAPDAAGLGLGGTR